MSTPRAGTPLLHAAVDFHGRTDPDRIAVREGDRATTYGSLRAQMWSIASGLRHHGVQRIGIAEGNTTSHLLLLLGGACAGVTAAPLHPSWTSERIRQVADLLALDAILGSGGVGTHDRSDVVAARPGPDASPGFVDPDQWQLLAPTGGTSGRLKAVAISHSASAARATAQALAFGGGPGTRFVVTTPLFHGAARGGCFAQLLSGGSIDLHDDFDSTRFSERVVNATSTFCVPTMLRSLLETDCPPLPRALTIIVSGASLDPVLAKEAMDRLGCRLVNYYASVEAGGIAARLITRDKPPDSTVGYPFLGTTIVLEMLKGRSAPAPDGAVGAVIVRSEGVAAAVIDHDGRQHDLSDGVRTGDLARWREGELILEGRVDDMIITGGVNVAPDAVEAVLRSHDRVLDVVVTGVQNTKWGQVVGCLLVLDDADIGAIEEWAQDKLGTAERPRLLRAVDAIPLTAMGKPDRTRAAELLGGST